MLTVDIGQEKLKGTMTAVAFSLSLSFFSLLLLLLAHLIFLIPLPKDDVQAIGLSLLFLLGGIEEEMRE